MKVLHFCKSFSLLSETFIYDYVTELERQGVDNHVLTFRRVNEESRPFPKVTVVDRPSRWHPRRLWNRALVPAGLREKGTSFWPQIRDRLETAVREMEPDVVHAHFGPAGVLIAPVAQRMDIPLTVTFYGYDISELIENDFWRRNYSRLWSRVDAVTVLSERMKQTALRLGVSKEKIEVVHLSRELQNFPFRTPPRKVKKILFVGRLVRKKAPLDALRALQIANENGVNLELEIAGNGPLEESVRSFVEKQGMEEEVVLHGRVPSEEVTDLMRGSDAFLLPSRTAPNGDREGTPTVLVEAQAVGLPCVTTRHAGIPEMIPEENHDLLADGGDTEALGEILYSLASLSREKLTHISQCGRRKVENEFNLAKEVNNIRSLYKKNIFKRE